MKYVTRLINLQDGTVLGFVGLDTIHRLMQMWVETLAGRVDALDAELGEIVQELFVDELETLAIIFVSGLAVHCKRVLEAVDDGDQRFDEASGIALGIFRTLFVDALAVIVKIGLTPEQCLLQILQITGQPGNFRIRGGGIRRDGLGLWRFLARLVSINVKFFVQYGVPLSSGNRLQFVQR